MTINAKDLKTIKSDLAQRRKARLAAADDRDLSTKETILRLAPELRKMKRHGFTTTELVEVLKGHGLGIKGVTLNRYLAESQPTKAKNAKEQSQNKTASPCVDETEGNKNHIVSPSSNVGAMR